MDGTEAVAALDAVHGEPWQVEEVVLMRSVLGPKPSYDVLDRWRLAYQA
jgi:2'-5' RNA ligase